jgi:SAM-dependent methyltransferase
MTMQNNGSETNRAAREAPVDHGHPYPPGHLRFRVHGGRDIEGYANNGRMASENLVALFLDGLLRLPAGAKVLDFGCGPGRVMTWFQQEHKDWTFFGTDIDPEAIEWAQKRSFRYRDVRLQRALAPLRTNVS